MFSTTLSVATVALAASAVVNAQTFTSCNPTQQSCPADPAFGTSVNCDFTKGPCDIFETVSSAKVDEYGGNGAVFSIKGDNQAPTLASDKYIFFGKVEAQVQAAPGVGIVTAIVLQSDDLDEMDWEWIGSDDTQVQTNYFTKGDTTTYDRGAFSPVDSPTTSFHTYTIEWTSKAVNWMIDGKTVRTLSADAVNNKYPQSPMQIKIGTWCAGCPSSPQGTRQWAGGDTDFSKAPFNAFYKSITIVDYAGKDSPANGGVKEYIYGDRSGTWQSIKVVGGGSSDSGSSDSGSSGSGSSSSGSSTGDSPASSKREAPTPNPTSDSATTILINTTTPTDGVASSTGAVTTPGRPTGSFIPSAAAASRGSVAIAAALMAGVGVVLVRMI